MATKRTPKAVSASLDFAFFQFLWQFYQANRGTIRTHYKELTRKFLDFNNPEILAVAEEEETAYEGCLSFPGHNGAVTRPVAVKVRKVMGCCMARRAHHRPVRRAGLCAGVAERGEHDMVLALEGVGRAAETFPAAIGTIGRRSCPTRR